MGSLESPRGSRGPRGLTGPQGAQGVPKGLMVSPGAGGSPVLTVRLVVVQRLD
ncbi:PREDICTED: LOW QUALITY PROTEIN: collagen alpha-1(I) chain-like, partial [Tinamus guttatus]|uniref:LOW QUALITY PROTEIN: collagen alpha-1(I) chain-like n=1 Tax=Tinamus guttatus TaxID=94827 RepID=UPI00052F0034